MQSIATAAPTQAKRSTPKRSPQRQTPPQPLNIITVDGAWLRLETLAALSGRSVNTLYRDAKAGKLVMKRHSSRCTRVKAEDARQYLARLAEGGQ